MQCCSPDGTVYDLSNIVPYIQHFHRHPVTGADLHLKDIIQLTFHKNAAGEYHCPVLNKVFTEHTHILAVKPSGNVYCGEVSLLGEQPLVHSCCLVLTGCTRWSGHGCKCCCSGATRMVACRPSRS